MSVPKGKRRQSRFEAQHHYYRLRDEVTRLMLQDFGFSPEKYQQTIDYYRRCNESAENVDEVVARYEKKAESIGLFINNKKTHIEKLSGNYKYLQIRYTLTDTGKVIRRINQRNIIRERRKLKAYKRLNDRGRMPVEDIENAFKSWMGTQFKYMSNQQIINMLTLYQDLFRRELKWRKQSRLRWLTEQSSKISD